MIHYVLSYIENPKIIFEAGAADGRDTVILSNAFKNATVYAFEPVKEYYDIALEKTKHLNNVKLYNFALGEMNGEMDIYISRFDDGRLWCSSSLLKPKEHLIWHPDIKFPEIRKTKVVTLDTFCEENNINFIDFFWLDLQGYEMKMLKASPKILKNIKCLYTEINMYENYENGETFEIYKSWLMENGFELISIVNNYGDQGDALFVRK